MDTLTISIIAIAAFFVLIFFKIPIAFAFAMVGTVGLIFVKGLTPALNLLGSAPYTWSTNGALLALPLFVLMGQFVFRSGISTELFDMGYKWVGKFRGGLAIATELASTAFGACCGASIASAATMGTVAYPEMKKYHYDDALACGSIAAGGSLSTLIPPSAPFIVFGFLTSTSISALFIAGILPGIMLSALYIGIIIALCRRNPRLGPPGPAFTWKQRLIALRGVFGALALFVLIMGGMFLGFFTPSEAGAVGAFGAFVIMILKRRMNIPSLWLSLKESIVSTCFILTITIGAMIFTNFLTVCGFASMFANWITGLPLSPTLIMVCILLIYIPLGCVMDSLAMILLTVPIVFPIVKTFGYDPIWFGVVVAILSEAALLTPPVGMNSFIVHGVTKVPLHTVFRGIIPFFVMMAIGVAVLFAFPEIVTILPGIMK